MFESRFMPCPECGASLDRSIELRHECSSERRADYQMVGLHERITRLQDDVEGYLDTPAGRFEVWLAARQVRRPD